MATPTGYTAGGIVSFVRGRLNEPSIDLNLTVQALNAAIEQIVAECDPIITMTSPPLAVNQPSVTLPADLMRIKSVSFSYPQAPITQIGVTVIAVIPRTAEEFYDIAGGAPSVGAGGPLVYFIQTDQSNVMTLFIYPFVAQAGQLNIFYSKRPNLWDPTNSGSTTDMDSAWQECCVLFALSVLAESLEKYDAVKIYDAKYDAQLAKAKSRVKERTRTKQAQVRDVMGGGSGGAWPGWTVGRS